MNIKGFLSKTIKNPVHIFMVLGDRGLLDWIPDRIYIKIMYRNFLGKKLNLKNPVTFNEKLQWLKLNNRKPEYSIMVDKYAVKEYIKALIGEQYVIPTLGVWDSFKDINFELLPDQFVLKCTHDSGGLIICKDKSHFDTKHAQEILEKCLRYDFFKYGREWPYKNVRPRIICEKYIAESDGSDLKDYKFFCFNGKAEFFKIDFDRFTNHHANYYDMNYNLLPFGEAQYMPNPEKDIQIPKTIESMKTLAEKIAKNIPFLRVDFYDTGEQIFFGEITFYPASGFGKFYPDDWDTILGKMIQL